MKMNNKRLCGFCKLTFRSQHVYNHHVNSCTEIPTKRVDTRAKACYPKNGPRPQAQNRDHRRLRRSGVLLVNRGARAPAEAVSTRIAQQSASRSQRFAIGPIVGFLFVR